MRNFIANMTLVVALILGALGSVISFYPGAEANYFGIVSLLAFLGVISNIRRLQVVALITGAIFAALAVDGYFHGVRYRETLAKHNTCSHAEFCGGGELFAGRI